MTATNPSIIITGSEDQLIRLTEIRDKLISEPATEATLGEVISHLAALLIELQGKADLTEAQPITGTVAIANFPDAQTFDGNVVVTNFPATQAISALSLPLPTGAASATNQSSQITIETAIRDRLPVNLGASTAANSLPVTLSTDGAFSTGFGTVADVAAISDTGSFSFLAFLKRLLSFKLPSALTANGNFKVAIAESITRTPTYISTSTSGTIAAGAQSIAIANVGSAAGIVKGVSLPAGASLSWGANGSDTLASLSYDATNTAFLITTVI